MPTTNAQQFEADLKAAKNGDTVTLKGNITKDIVINKLINLDLNGKTITGNVTINTPAKGTMNLKNGSITGNLTVDAPQATVNNELTVSGNININNVAYGTWNERANGNSLFVHDPDGIKVIIYPGVRVAAIAVAPEAVGNVTITNNGTIEKVDAQASVELVNNGSVEEIAGNSEVKLSGTGTVDKVTNEKPVVNESNQDAFLTKSGDLTLNQDRYETSFKWGSNNGIGSGEKSAHTSPGGYNYFGNGAYLDITVKKEGESSNAKFDDVLSQLTLQTNGGATDDISGGAKTDGRQPADWGKSTANQSFATKLKESGSNAVFYGVRQNNTNGVATVGFNAGEKRDVNLTFSPKDGLAEGTYTITVQPKQQVSETAGKNIGDAITYTFSVNSIFEAASTYTYQDYSYVGNSVLSKTQSGVTIESTYSNGTQLLDGTAMNDMARYLGALQYANNGRMPESIVYNGNTYQWNPTSAVNLKGSNWYDSTNSKTLVSAITADIQAIGQGEGGQEAAIAKVNEGITVSVDGVSLTLKSKAQQ
ncbi:hypothetical protein [Sporosarcina obsidiansis]|uniref:hypothetical protein n=1 Tax=Sporosarcina obsidiansis TaxID=2660748 RepID=UPI00129AC697|nr:hypothetical protein [Sporosarcina obsidiansis]